MIFLHPIAIKPFLKCYLAHYCTIEPAFVITQNNRFASYLANCLRHKTTLEVLHKRYTISDNLDNIMVQIPEYYSHQHGINISLKHQHSFNRFLQDDFRDKMMATIVPGLKGKKGEIKTALQAFRERYKITEDDLPFKTLEKIWERNRKNIDLYRSN